MGRARTWAWASMIVTVVSTAQAVPEGLASVDSVSWQGPLGMSLSDSVATFHLFAPRALSVDVHLYNEPFGPPIASHSMMPIGHGCWTSSVVAHPSARYFAYTIAGPEDPGELFDPSVAVADPYSKAITTQNHYTQAARTLLRPPSDFDWDGDSWVTPPTEELIIYEAHVRDLTADASSGVPDSLQGAYLGLCHRGAPGGLSYLLDLGVNAVELLPVHEFANIEVPYRDSTVSVFNTWNPYERNHWGYMTSFFFAPEAYYATDQSLDAGGVCGADGRQVTEFKQLVKTLHRHGIAVILDVVYNHVSQYDLNPLKAIDSWYYFRRDEEGKFLSLSGCGNDLKTEAPMARRLIVDSVLFWMQEYHIDGFRFDLATMIDDETLAEISREAREVNPRVILIAEPWGGGEYDLGKFSRLGWSVWNDRVRNGIKGRTPGSEPGFVFGSYLAGEDSSAVLNHLTGSVASGGGPLLWPWHSVNYLESHDDHTLGDFVRITLEKTGHDDVVGDDANHLRLTPEELRVHRLAALALFCSQGSVMLAQGQEFARTKVIASTDAPDTSVGRIDHNSYAKDNETNWLNYDHAAINRPLLDYYKSLIRLRRAYRGLGGARPELITPWATGDSLCMGVCVDATQLGDPGDLLILLNGAPRTVKVDLPDGRWRRLVKGQEISVEPRGAVSGSISLSRTEGALLIREG